MSKTVITYVTVFGFRNTTHLTAKSLTVSSSDTRIIAVTCRGHCDTHKFWWIFHSSTL